MTRGCDDQHQHPGDDGHVGQCERRPPPGVQVVGDHPVTCRVRHVAMAPPSTRAGPGRCIRPPVSAARHARTATTAVISPVTVTSRHEGASAPKENVTPELYQGAASAQMVLETGRPTAQVARDFGVHDGTLGNRVATWRRDHPRSVPDLSPAERARVSEMEAEIRRLRMEDEFLRRTAAFFAKTQPWSRRRSGGARRLGAPPIAGGCRA